MHETFEVIIVGGGLAGSSTASVLARVGLDVLVLERVTAFRNWVRGEWLAPWGILEADPTKPKRRPSSPLRNGSRRPLPRRRPPQLQEALLAHAAQHGATVR